MAAPGGGAQSRVPFADVNSSGWMPNSMAADSAPALMPDIGAGAGGHHAVAPLVSGTFWPISL